MKYLAWAIALWCLLANPAGAGELSAAEAGNLRTEIAIITTAVEQGDPEAIIERTHPSLKAMVGGEEAFATMTRQAMQLIRDGGIRIVSSEVGTPTPLYAAGEEEVCFVPRVTVMEIGDRKAKSTTFMVAIRKVGGGDWTYLDGAGLRKRPEMLHQLLPRLQRDVALPPNTIELLDPDDAGDPTERDPQSD